MISFRPLNGGGEVADDGLKPDVDAAIFPAIERDGDAPIEIASVGAILEALREESVGEIEHLRAPVGLVLQPLLEAVSVFGELHHEVGAGAELGSAAVERAARVDELTGVESAAAAVALIAACGIVAAMGACAVDVAIRQVAILRRAVGDFAVGFVEEALFVEAREEVL